MIWREPRGIDAGYDTPQFCIHRGKLHKVLLAAAVERLGHRRIHTGWAIRSLASRPDRAVAAFQARDGSGWRTVARAPFGFDDINAVLPHEEREAIVRGYARLAGYSVNQVNRA